MAVIVDSCRFENDGVLYARPNVAVFLGPEFDIPEALFTVMLGAKWKAAKVAFQQDADLSVSAAMHYVGSVQFDQLTDFLADLVSGASLYHVGSVAFEQESDLVVDLRRIAVGAVAFDQDAELLVEFAPTVPAITYPLEGQEWGTVNLTRNPSLESDDVGLTDWSATAGITLTRTDLAEAYTGVYTGRAEIGTGVGSPAITVKSQEGLGLAGARMYVGSAALRSDDLVGAVDLWIVFTYLDGTSVDQVGIVSVTPTTTWDRYATDPAPSDPAKVLSRIDLVVRTYEDASLTQVLRLDAVQTEEALSGGASPYADGDQGEHHWWAGTPGRSMSVRDTA